MRVRTYLAILILGYSICGLTVFYILNYFHQGESQLADSVSQSELTLRDVRRLEENFSHWMLLSDLVLGADESYLCEGALQVGAEIDSILENLSSEIDSTSQASTLDLQSFAGRQKDRLLESRKLNSADRHSKMQDLLTQMDVDSERAIVSLGNLHSEIQQIFEENKSQLDKRLSYKPTNIRILLLGFLGSALLLWLWISSIVSQPISMLARQSRIKHDSVRDFEVKSSAPSEIKQLAGSLGELVDDLEYQIEEHKKTQVERAKLHNKLMDSSRRAGMADVASEVLHNVGNVLNSMNVSATVVRNSLQKSLTDKLAIASRRFLEHENDFASYLETDEKGKHFPAALDFISQSLVTDHGTHIEETERLIKNISHVRTVIQRQLSMSCDKGVIETFCLLELIQECVAINDDKADQIDAVITYECLATITLTTDRHKLQQALINLIANALDAVEGVSRTGRVEVIADRQLENVAISVTDNGTGIAEENLVKIFSQGFTTKIDGHGFGLHSCSLTAQALGGNLEVTSKGRGQGATFHLVIPMRQSELCRI